MESTKKYGAMVDGYWVSGYEKGTLKTSENFDDLIYVNDKEQVVRFFKNVREHLPNHEYTLVTITIDLEDVEA